MTGLFYVWGIFMFAGFWWQVGMLVDEYWSFKEKPSEGLSLNPPPKHYYTTQTEFCRLRKRAAIYSLGVPFRIVFTPLYFSWFVLKNAYKGIKFLIKAATWEETPEVKPEAQGPYR